MDDEMERKEEKAGRRGSGRKDKWSGWDLGLVSTMVRAHWPIASGEAFSKVHRHCHLEMAPALVDSPW